MSAMKWFGILATAGALVLGTGGAGSAKPLLQEDFRAPSGVAKGGEIITHGSSYGWKGPGGDSTTEKGGYVTYDAKSIGLSADAGTVEPDVTRGESNADSCESLFSFGDAAGKRLFSFRIDWEVRTQQGTVPMVQTFAVGPAHLFYNMEEGDLGVPVEQPGLYLNRRVGKGQTIHLALTWGAAGTKVYLDGKELKGEVRFPQFFKQYIPKTEKFIVGAEISDREWLAGKVWCTTHSMIANVQVHDRQLKATELEQAFTTGADVAAVAHNAFQAAGFSGKLVAGNKFQVTVNGTAGATGTFDLLHYPAVDGKIALDWRGWGVYLEDKTSYGEGEVDLRYVNGYRVYAARTPIAEITEEMIPVTTLKVGEQSYTLEFLEIDQPYYVAVVAEMSDGTLKKVIWPVQNIALAETAAGVYTGEYTVTYQDRFARAVVVGRLTKGADVTTAVDPNTIVIDPALTIAVATSPSELRADEKSTSQVTVTVTDANGDAVAGHKMKFLLATTSQYTGVVGGGAFAEQVGGELQESTWGETDLFGRITATYVAGFAAKTAVIVARDMVSNSTGAGYVKTYIQTTAELVLEPVVQSVAAAEGYVITVTSSDDWLTADGKSQARITATVTLGGEPVPDHKVTFDVTSGTGSIRTVKDTTDKNGEARAVYTAGKKIGIVLISATDVTVGVSGSVQIELRSDAPAKIKIQIKPEKLPADGHSTADLHVQVTDINDNPNDNTEIEYAIAQGSGRIRSDRGLTDRNGENSTEYVAGKSAGKVVFEITVRSTVPTEEEMAKARDLALAVTDYDFF